MSFGEFPNREAVFESFARHVNPGKVATYRQYELDVVMGERSGATFQDQFSERAFYNCHSNGGVFNLGHRNPRIIAAVQSALARFDIGNHHFVSGPRAALAERLVATTDGKLPGVVFGVSGGEAIDLAIKAARAGSGRQGIISATGGYHGHTGLALAAGDAQYRDPFGSNLPGFAQVPFGDLPALESALGDDTAAVLLEPIPATLGMPIPPEGYLVGVQAACRKRGAKLLIDEVQTGLGRTGKLWAYQHEGIEPDAVITGKGLSGGIYPITATLLSAELHKLFEEHPFVHISTFGGSEIGCCAAAEVLDISEESGFLDHVNELSDYFAEALVGLPFELRRRGLMMGLVFGGESAAMLATKLLYDQGIFAIYANNDPSVLQFLPPLTLEIEDAKEIVRRIRQVFGG